VDVSVVIVEAFAVVEISGLAAVVIELDTHSLVSFRHFYPSFSWLLLLFLPAIAFEHIFVFARGGEVFSPPRLRTFLLLP
jgi:hypothetical protein